VRIAVLDTVYPAFIETFYGRSPGLADRPYEAQLDALLEFSFGTSDAYTAGLWALGHESWNLITNCLPLQLAWVKRNRLRRLLRLARAVPGRPGNAARHGLFQAIAAAQVDALDPHVVFVHDTWSIESRVLDRWRRQGRFVVGQIASPAPPVERLRRFDLMLSSFHHFVERFRADGIDSEFFRLAFYDRVIDRLKGRGVDAAADSQRSLPVSFVGGLHLSTHGEGTRLLEDAARELPLALWGYGGDELAADSPIRAARRGEAWGIEMFEILADSRIVLNRHIDVAEGQANNMRLYEATGCGALLLTDAGRGLDELFADGEVVSYDSRADLVDKAHHYLEHDDERVAIARAGQARTLREHTYAARMAELDAMLQARMGAISSNQPRYASTIDPSS
jgi:spore maturation protein CgeB